MGRVYHAPGPSDVKNTGPGSAPFRTPRWNQWGQDHLFIVIHTYAPLLLATMSIMDSVYSSVNQIGE